MGQVAVKQELKAGEVLDIFGAFERRRVPIKFFSPTNNILVGYIKCLKPASYGLLAEISFVAGRHVKNMRGHCHEGYQFEKNSEGWELVKRER